MASLCLGDSTVVFNEIMYHPPGNEAQLEWIELHNQMAVHMDLSGWRLAGGVDFAFPAGTVVPGGGFLVVAADPDALRDAGVYAQALGPFTRRLSNSGERLELRNNNDRLMDSVAYESSGRWPVAPGGSGVSLAKVDPDLGSAALSNWAPSTRVGGTPGAHNFTRQAGGGAPAEEGLVSFWKFDDPVLGGGTYTEDFAQPDGFPVDWHVHQGDAHVAAGALRLTAAQSVETFAWAGVGGAPIQFTEIQSLTVRISFPGQPGDSVGRHGGMVLCCSEPTERWSPFMSGYMIDWIDRTGDHGYRIIKMSNGEHSGLGSFQTPVHPGAEWRVEFTAEGFSLYVDDVPIGTYADADYRGGYVGMWCYSNAGQDMRVDDVSIAYRGVAQDSMGGNHGLVGGGVTATEGLVGAGAARFDGSAEAFVDVGPGAGGAFAVTGGVTIEALCAPLWSGAPFTRAVIFSKDDGARRMALEFVHDGDAVGRDVPISPAMQPVLSFGLNAGGAYTKLDMPLDGLDGRPSLAQLLDGAAHHVAAVYDAATGRKTLYVNGAPRFSAVLQAGALIESGGGAPAIIGNSAGGQGAFTGIIDEVAFWDRALSAADIARHHANARDGVTYLAGRPGEEQDGPGLVFNETWAGAAGEGWVELYNAGAASAYLDGMVLRSSAGAGPEFVFGAVSIAPGAWRVFEHGELGLPLVADSRLFLYTPDGTAVVDAVLLAGGGRARYPDGTGDWYIPDGPTPGAENAVTLTTAAVISEIMYHPMDDPEENGEYIEVCNRGGVPLDLSGFALTDGIQYTFPEGTVLAAGEYIVVARNPQWIRAEYGDIRVVGPYMGRLSNRGERIALVDAHGSIANEVTYFDDSPWPRLADGGGSSLELRDLWADNSVAEAWSASNEAARSEWRRVTYSAVAAADRGPTQWNEFVMGLLSAGEVLIDDLSVIESPSGARVQLLQNGTFESGLTAWRCLGTHRHSTVVDDPDAPGQKVLALVATGSTEHMHNHLETTFAGGRRVTNGREYEVSFRARWLGGSRLLNTRLYFNRCARTTVLAIPRARGTPGAPNSIAEENIGPTFTQFAHAPVVPEPLENVTVAARVDDPDGVARVMLRWALDGGAWADVPMALGTDGQWRGVIPGQTQGRVVQFYAEAEDGRGAVSFFPAGGPASRALFKVQDGQARLGTLNNLRIIMKSADVSFMHTPTNVMSNEMLGATVIANERRVHYDVGVRLKSSQRGRLASTRVGFSLRFQADALYRGVHRTVGIDRSGGIMFGRAFGQDEIVVKHIVNHAGGIAGMFDDMIWVIAPQSAQTGTALLLMARFNDVFLDSQWEDGSRGMLYTYELIYYPTTTVDGRADGLKLPQPDQVIACDIQDLGDDKEAYRWFFLIENNRARDDYEDLIRFCKGFNAPSAELEARAREVMDVDQWMRTFAMYSLCGIGDTYTQGLDHNNMHYVRPDDGRILVFPWDMDFAFVRSTNAALWGDRNLARIIALPPFTRMFYRHLGDIIATTFNREYLDPWILHYGGLVNQDFRPIMNYVAERRAYVLSRIPAGVPFDITTASGADHSVDATDVRIEGRCPVEAVDIELNGVEAAVSWRSVTRWAVDIPLAPGPNPLHFVARGAHGAAIGEAVITVTSTVEWHPPTVLAIVPAGGPSTGGTTVQLFGENFDPMMEVRFGGVAAEAPTFINETVFQVVTPPGRGAVVIEVANPDGLAGVAPEPFVYADAGTLFRRADANMDGMVNIADAVEVLGYLFAGAQTTCRDALDTNDDGAVDVADAVYLLAYLFAGGAPPPPPFDACGLDPTPDDLDCVAAPSCP